MFSFSDVVVCSSHGVHLGSIRHVVSVFLRTSCELSCSTLNCLILQSDLAILLGFVLGSYFI